MYAPRQQYFYAELFLQKQGGGGSPCPRNPLIPSKNSPMALFPQLLQHSHAIAVTCLSCPTITNPTDDLLTDSIGAELEAGRFLDGEIRELRAGIERRKRERARREKEKGQGRRGGANVNVALLKERLRRLRLELFDKTVDQSQVHNLVEKMKMSQPALEAFFPGEFGNNKPDENTTEVSESTSRAIRSMGALDKVTSSSVKLASQLREVRKEAMLKERELRKKKVDNEARADRLEGVLDRIKRTKKASRGDNKKLEKNKLLRKAIIKLIVNTGIEWVGNSRLTEIMMSCEGIDEVMETESGSKVGMGN